MDSRSTTRALHLTAALLLAACVQHGRAPESSPESDGAWEHRTDPALLGSLSFRDFDVAIRLGRDGPLYTVTSKDGELLARDVSANELARIQPVAHMLVADGSLWAGM